MCSEFNVILYNEKRNALTVFTAEEFSFVNGKLFARHSKFGNAQSFVNNDEIIIIKPFDFNLEKVIRIV